MKKYLFILSALLSATTFFTSCSDDDENNNGNSGNFSSDGCYIVNQGGFKENDGSIQFYDFSNGTSTPADAESNIFVQQNGEMLGDLVQDLIWVKGKLFVTVSGSQKIEVLEENGKRICEPYKFTVEGASPRMMATDGTNVYVTNYDNNVYVYDASTAEFLEKIPVSTRPEGISYCNGYLVVNNSGALYSYNGTVSIIDLESGNTKSIQMCNPYVASVVCNDNVYIIDSGNYYDIPSSIYRISPEDGTAESLNISASLLAAYDNKLYYANTSYLEDWTPVYSPLYELDTTTGEKREVVPADKMTNIYSLSVNPENGDIYIGYAEYGVLGTMRVYATDGTEKSNFGIGYYTSGARFENLY